MDKTDLKPILYLIGVLVALLVVSHLMFRRWGEVVPETKEGMEPFINLNTLDNIVQGGNMDVAKQLFASDVSIRNESTMNCYEYMKSKNLAHFIDESDTKEGRAKMKVLGTMRTNMNHTANPAELSAVTMHACHFPNQISNGLYRIHSQASCNIDDRVNGRSVELKAQPEGCTIDFNDPNTTKESFNHMLDVAYFAYDEDNQMEIKRLKERIAAMRQEVAELNEYIRSCKEGTCSFNQKTNALVAETSECGKKRKEARAMEAVLNKVLDAFTKARDTHQYFMGLDARVKADVKGLDNEYNTFIQLKQR